jgi:hypothetical protein
MRYKRRGWTAREDAYLRRHYRRDRTAAQIGEALRRSLPSIFARAESLGLARRLVRRKIGSGQSWERIFRRLHAQGYSDAEIAGRLKCDRKELGKLRRTMGLSSNAYSARFRRKVRARTGSQLRAAGLKTLAELRIKVWREKIRGMGWPEDLRPRAAQILDVLYYQGPLTRRQIAEKCGMPWKGSRQSLCSSDPEGTYLAHLQRRGLVVALGRSIRSGPNSGQWCNLYAVPMGVAPSPVERSRKGEEE